MNMTFAVCWDAYEAGLREDGTPFVGERYFVRAESEDGRRFRYHKEWNGVDVSQDDHGNNYFADVRPRAKALAEAVCRTVTKVKFEPTSNDWFEDRPVYGSDAFIAMQAYGSMMDREEFDAGFNYQW